MVDDCQYEVWREFGTVRFVKSAVGVALRFLHELYDTSQYREITRVALLDMRG